MTGLVAVGPQGYIRRTDSILHVPALHQFSQPGRAFDPESWLSLVPVVLHATCIMVLNQVCTVHGCVTVP